MCSVVLPRAVVADPALLTRALLTHGCTRLVVVPTLLQLLVSTVWAVDRYVPS